MTSSIRNHRLSSSLSSARALGVLIIVYCVQWNVDATTDAFSALVDIQKALDDEQTAADLLRHYIRQQRQCLEKLQLVADEWENHSKNAMNNIEQHVFHPVNYFLLTKYYAVHFGIGLRGIVAPDAADEFLSTINASTPNFPGQEAYELSASALLKLQDVYNLPVERISNGQIDSKYNTQTMSADDCFQLGKVAYDNNDFYHAVIWLNETMRIGDMENNRTVPKAIVMEHLCLALVKQGNLRHAYNLTLRWLQTEPRNAQAMNIFIQFREMLINDDGQVPSCDGESAVTNDEEVKNDRQLDEVHSTQAFADYERLCRQEKISTSNALGTELTCTLRRHVPMFYIRPLKEELISLEPRVAIYHDILTDSEILTIQRLATPKLHRSGVIDSNDGTTFVHGRASKSAWLSDYEDPLIARVSRRAAALSNLTLETAEELQVLNYGIGGHYEPHHDFVPDNLLESFGERGNRVATVILYLNDVDYGGFTVFNVAGIGVPPSKGSCMLWYNLMMNGEGDQRTVHAGCPVVVGTKWVANKWFHIRGQEFTRLCNLNPDE